MQPVVYNGFVIATDTRIGSYSVQQQTPSQYQLDNANCIKSFFIAQGWTLEAICGMLGNMQGESSINPAFIQATNRFRLPNSAADISDVPNSVMVNFYKEYYGVTRRAFAIGLVQWDGASNSSGTLQQKLVGYAIRNNFNWFDGWGQCYRLRAEWQQDAQYHFFNPVTISGVQYTFANYVTSTASPSDLAAAWSAGYERNAGGVGFRGINAEWWYTYFTETAPEPVEIANPFPADSSQPPFDPLNPVPADPDAADQMPAWLWWALRKRKKEVKHIWRRI